MALLACGGVLAPPPDPCRSKTCSGHGTCMVAQDTATCRCDPGYLPAAFDACVPDQSVNGCGGACCSGGQQGYCNNAPCGTTASKRDCCIVVGGEWKC